MASLLSGRTLRTGGSGQYIDLAGAQPQLPATPDTSTGYTVVTSDKLVTTYRSSLGNLEMNSGTVYNNLPNTPIVFIGTGTSNVQVRGTVMSVSTDTGALTVEGGVGIGGALWTAEDIHVNGLLIGQGLKNYEQGQVNNIVIQGVATTQTNDFANGQENIVIGHSALDGLGSAIKNIAIGRYAISSGTGVENTIAIGDSALKNIGTYQYLFVSTITNITTSSPVLVTSPGHALTTGTRIVVTEIVGPDELNEQKFYVIVVDSSTLALYNDIIFLSPLDGSALPPYQSGGKVNVTTVWNSNVAIGVNAGISLIDGQENFLLGYNIATNLTTGSYNFFMGHSVASNMTRGNSNISIGGDNLVDGLDNQINIGSMLYYNGYGYTQMNTDLGVGFGTTATDQTFKTLIDDVQLSTPGNTATIVTTREPHGIVPGQSVSFIGVEGLTELNDSKFFVKVPAPDQLVLYTDGYLTNLWDSSEYIEYTGGGEVYLNELIAAVSVLGGVAISENLIVEKDLTVRGNFYGAGLATTEIQINGTVTNTTYYLGLADNTVGDSSPISASLNLNFNTADDKLSTAKLAVISTAVSTSTTTGAVTVAGGLGVAGSVYSADGNPQENYLLYTPKFTATDTGFPPADPKVGDFWVDTVFGAYLQYIKDGTSTFWIQISNI